jgi:hypothetical protein
MFMMHDEAVLALAFSRDSELLVSGVATGEFGMHSKAGVPFAQLAMECRDGCFWV